MLKSTLFIVLFSFGFFNNLFSQKLKLRLDIGNAINYSSYRSKLFQKYYQGPISTSEYTYKKRAAGSLIGSKEDNWIPQNYALLLDFDYKERNHFTLGYMLWEGILVKDIVVFNYGYYTYNGHSNVVLPLYSELEVDYLPNKISLDYSRDYGNGLLRFSPLLGISYLWFPGATALDTLDIYYDTYANDLLYNNSPFYIKQIKVFTEHTSSFMLSVGFNLRVHSKKRELFALKLFYQQGLRPLIMNQAIIERNNKRFIYNVSYSYGSALYLKLSIPIPIYNFDKRKHKKE